MNPETRFADGARGFQPLEFYAPKVSSRWNFFVAALLCAAAVRAQEAVNYEEHIKPLFRSHCNQCHNPDKAKGGLDMSTYGALLKGGGSGVGLVAGDPDGSLLYLSMTHQKEPFMPKEGDKRPAAELDLVKRWIQGGLIEKRGGVARVSEKPKISFDASAMAGARPAGPPPMPEFESEPPVFVSDRANAIKALAASPWAPLVAVGGSQQVVLYNSDTFAMLATLRVPDGEPSVLKFSRNAKLLMCGGGVGGQSGRVVLWDVKSGEKVAEVGDEYDTVLAADVRADQKLVALGGPQRKVRVYDTSSGEKLYEIKKHTEWVTAMEFSPDGILLATGDRNGGLFIWEAEGGQPFYDLAGHQAMITKVSWRGDGNALASASEDGSVRMWNPHDGKQLKTFTAHAGGVQALEFMRDGKLLTCGRDKTVKLWSPDGNLLKTISGFDEIATAVAGTHDSGRIIAGDWTGALKVFSTADAGFVGRLRANPPSLAARILDAEAAREPLRKRAADLKVLAEQAAATLAEREKVLGDAQKNAVDKAAKVVAAEAALAVARKELDDANGLLAAAKQDQSNKDADLAMRIERSRQANEREAAARGEKDEMNRQLAEHSRIVEEMKKLVAAAQAAPLPSPNDAALFDQIDTSARKQNESATQVAALSQRLPNAQANVDKLAAEAKEAASVIKAGQDTAAAAKGNTEQKQAAANQATAKKDEAEKQLAAAKTENEQATKYATEKQAQATEAKTAANTAADTAAIAQKDLVTADKLSDRLKAEQFDAIVKRAENKLRKGDDDKAVTLDEVVDVANKAIAEYEPPTPPKVSEKNDGAAGVKREETPRALIFLGRFHMVMLHLPIGALLLALLLEFDRFLRKTEQTDYIITQTLRFGAAFAIISSTLGWLLSWDNTYDPAELSLHKWLGVGATAAAVISAWLRNRPHAAAKFTYWLALLSTGVLLMIAGHEGGNLTHGRGFLTQYYPDFVGTFTGRSSAAADTSEYGVKIKPILEQHCISCHGEKKQKGDLRLDQKSAALGAGESGKKAIIPGNALKSEVVIRMLLARDHDDVMPPSNKPAMKDSEIFAIINWINEGAEWPETPAAPVAPASESAKAATTNAALTNTTSTMSAPLDATHGTAPVTNATPPPAPPAPAN